VTVYLVGAGPGDPGLLTVRGAELLRSAEVVVHDRLIGPRILDLAPPTARLVDVGKSAGSAPTSQEDTNALLVALGREARAVVRLKGGDPYVFGRGGEEAIALAAAEVDYEVVPGVPAATAVAACAGVPLTHRGVASGFAVVSGHDASSTGPGVDWGRLAEARCTVVVLMGAAQRALVAGRLLSAGRAPSTPVLVVERGSSPQQRSVRTTLGELEAVDVESPATIVVGEVAALRLASYEDRPLAGWRVVVTRAASSSAPLVALLERAGASVVELPVVEIRDPEDGGAALRAAADRLAVYDWVVVTSANGAERLLGLIRDARSLGRARVAAVGPATADAVRRAGIVPDLVPDRFVAEGLVDAFRALDVRESGRPGRVLLAQAAAARPVVADGLAALGWDVDAVVAYQTARATPGHAALDEVARADAVVFTSTSTVEGFLEVVDRERVPPVVASIGPVTTAAAESAGIRVSVEAENHTVAGVVDALSAFASSSGR
jgi:uroporphyrinogen III methyltransferase/synthase